MLTDIRVLPPIELPEANYFDHKWGPDSTRRVAAIKNYAIDMFLDTRREWLVLVDSDVILQPNTIRHLVEVRKPVVSAVFWSRWGPDRPFMPNVWEWPPYSFSSPYWIEQLRRPGHVEVGGLGACTLIHRGVLEQGVRFEPTSETQDWGEDRWFCARCAALKVPLVADTCVTPFHIYNSAAPAVWDAKTAELWISEYLNEEWWQRIKRGER